MIGVQGGRHGTHHHIIRCSQFCLGDSSVSTSVATERLRENCIVVTRHEKIQANEKEACIATKHTQSERIDRCMHVYTKYHPKRAFVWFQQLHPQFSTTTSNSRSRSAAESLPPPTAQIKAEFNRTLRTPSRLREGKTPIIGCMILSTTASKPLFSPEKYKSPGF